MKDSVYMAEMDAFTYREKIANNAIVFVPVGALEQHGSHMAMCVDAYLTKAMAGATAEKVGGICAEPIIYGFKSQQRSGGGFHLTGTTNLDGSTLIAVVRDICFHEWSLRELSIRIRGCRSCTSRLAYGRHR